MFTPPAFTGPKLHAGDVSPEHRNLTPAQAEGTGSKTGAQRPQVSLEHPVASPSRTLLRPATVPCSGPPAPCKSARPRRHGDRGCAECHHPSGIQPDLWGAGHPPRPGVCFSCDTGALWVSVTPSPSWRLGHLREDALLHSSSSLVPCPPQQALPPCMQTPAPGLLLADGHGVSTRRAS